MTWKKCVINGFVLLFETLTQSYTMKALHHLHVKRLKSKDIFCEATVAWKQNHLLYAHEKANCPP